MASFDKNIRNIRGEAIFGPDVRESIAEAIEGAQGMEGVPSFYERWENAMEEIGGKMISTELTHLPGTYEDYLLTIIGS